MKCIIFLFALIVVAIAAPPEKIQAFKEECRKEVGVSDEIFEKIKKHDLDFDDANGKCFFKCMCAKTGVCDGEFKLLADHFIAKKPDIDADKVRIFLILLAL